MRAALLFLVGGVFSALLLVAPATHAARWLGASLDPLAWFAIALPFLVLPTAAGRRHDWITLWAWPAAHLPALTIAPSLTAPPLYTGPDGLWATLALAVAGAAYLIVALWPDRPSTAGAAPGIRRATLSHPLALLALILALGVELAFLHAAIATHDVHPVAANLTLIVGAAVACWVAVRAIGTDLGGVVFDPVVRRRHHARLLVARRPPRRRRVVTFAVAAVLLGLLALYHLLPGP